MARRRKAEGAGANRPDETRLSFWFPKELARALKRRAVDEDRRMVAIVTDAVRAYLKGAGRGDQT